MIEVEDAYGTHTIENTGAVIVTLLLILFALIALSFSVGYLINKAA